MIRPELVDALERAATPAPWWMIPLGIVAYLFALYALWVAVS